MGPIAAKTIAIHCQLTGIAAIDPIDIGFSAPCPYKQASQIARSAFLFTAIKVNTRLKPTEGEVIGRPISVKIIQMALCIAGGRPRVTVFAKAAQPDG